MKKDFKTADVLRMTSGDIMNRELMDHLFPGIFSLGALLMFPRAQVELLRQHPQLRSAKAAASLPETLAIEGPLEGFP